MFQTLRIDQRAFIQETYHRMEGTDEDRMQIIAIH